ncbi:hypothetical protein [Pedobacter hiemivivus]|uniref:Lipoprotein n=1 Tax=Pedobacter hiemivivus TaxID=2530454 RepID=A0A4R0NGK1_9SPHI|nr:hypothetical protein [Pedobacter hiemivivus]TCC98392.1 hypothetical protein EZ444_03650 [Pedobacter hiemivivus]
MRKSTTILFMLLLGIMTFVSCKKDEKSNECDLTAETEMYQKKLNAFIENSTVANCNALRQYGLEVTKKAEKCTGHSKDAFLKVYEIYEEMDCSPFK